MSEPYATMADLARVYGVHLRTVRRWAAQDGWRRTRGRPVTYSVADAQRSYEKRHHGSVASHLVKRYGLEMPMVLALRLTRCHHGFHKVGGRVSRDRPPSAFPEATMADLPELALRPGYETPRDLPQGECILTTMFADGSVHIDRADPRILVSAELLAQVFAESAPGVSLTMADSPDAAAFREGAVLRIEGVNRTVIYRMVQYVPAAHGYIAEWPD